MLFVYIPSIFKVRLSLTTINTKQQKRDKIKVTETTHDTKP